MQIANMVPPPSLLLLVAMNFILVLFTSSYPQPVMSIAHNNVTDLESLLAFKAGIADPHGILATNWTTDFTFCSWIGVRCSQRRQRVVALELVDFSLQGTISPHLANLSFLSYLNLRNNTLTGHIPHEVSQLPRLAVFYLDYNFLTGTIPSSVFNMSSLVEVTFAMNNLSGSVHLNHETCMLTRLQVFSLSANNLTGNIPSQLSSCSNLRILSLSYNGFSGSIPPELGNNTSLNLLYLSVNQLNGAIPASIGNLTKLKQLDLVENYLDGEIPEELGNLLNLEFVNMAVNSLTGSIPVLLSNASSLNFLALTGNKLTGAIPATLGQSWRRLTTLKIGDNKLTGGLDFISSLANCKNLKVIGVAQNRIQGILPYSIGNLSTSVTILGFAYNNIKGEIPTVIGNLSSLVGLDLEANEFTGAIPSALSRLKRLQYLGLSHNRITGSIPFEFGLMTSLNVLYLSHTSLSGSIPDSFGNISILQHLDFAANELSSNIPDSLWSLRGLLQLNLSGNTLNGSLSPQISNLQSLYSLDLSKNRLSGNISTAFGKLDMLTYLDLSYNSFRNEIPKSLGGLINIEYMNLSYNSFSGVIPKSLANLTHLVSLDLSFNKLEGPIPEGGVFSNLSIPHLKGNAALCGAIQLGFSLCPSNFVTSNRKSKLHLLKYILPPIACAVVLLCCSCVGLFFCRRSTKSEVPPEDNPLNNFRAISYHELVRVTDNFSVNNLLGRGSFSSVFKAHLDDGLIAAVKVLNVEDQAALRSFDVEACALGKVRHRNLVKIISTCSNLDFKALVLQFMPNGSLEQWLHSHSHNCYLSLLQRINIMVDVSLAFEYLHHHHPQIVVHRDLKPSNVLLDEDMVGHVSDFGISKMLLSDSKSILSASAPGTFGYMAPEYGSSGKVSRKGDVYSFGILLLETFTGKKPSDAMFDGELSLRQWVNKAYPTAVLEIVDPILLDGECCIQQPDPLTIAHQCLSSLIELGLSCSMISPKERILMKDVVPKLQKIKAEYSKLIQVA